MAGTTAATTATTITGAIGVDVDDASARRSKEAMLMKTIHTAMSDPRNRGAQDQLAAGMRTLFGG